MLSSLYLNQLSAHIEQKLILTSLVERVSPRYV